MSQLTYFDVGTSEKPVISNSSLSCINPVEGGSWLKFLGFFRERDEEKTSNALVNGKLVHKYIETPDSFVIAEEVKPTQMMSDLIDKIALTTINYKKTKRIWNTDVSISADLTSDSKKEVTKQTDIANLETAYGRLSDALEVDRDAAIRIFRWCKGATNAYTSYKEDTTINNLLDQDISRVYLKFCLTTSNKVILNTKDGAAVKGAIASLQNHPRVSALLGLGNTELDAVTGEVFKELAIYWQEQMFTLDDTLGKVKINCKALLDRVIINHSSKTITYIDLKTTRGSLYNFQESMVSYRYYRQFAFYARALYFWFKNAYPDLDHNLYKVVMYIIPVETTGYHLTGVYDMDNAWIMYGRQELLPLVRRVGWHLATNHDTQSYEEITNKGILKFAPPV